MKRRWISVLMLLCISFTGCSESEEAAKKSDWHCEELLHNVFEEDVRITDEDYASEYMSPMKKYPLNLTEDYTLTGFFKQDVSLKPENASGQSREELKEMTYADAAYRDTWYFDLHDTENYLDLPEDLMPEMIRITYAPDGDINVNERETIIIAFCYIDEGKEYSSDGMVFVWYHGEDPTGGTWNWDWDNPTESE